MNKNWEIKRLEDLSDLITKGTTPTSVGYEFVEEGINFVKVESIASNGKFLIPKFAHITEECNEALKRSQLKENDILFSIAGALGRTSIVIEDILPANTNQALAIIRLKRSNQILPEFILKALSSEFIFEQIRKCKGGVAQQNLSLAQIKDFQIPVPPLCEQQRIVSILDETFAAIDKAKENAEQNLQNSRELFESYLQSVFSNSGDQWEVKSLGKVCDIIGGGTPSKANSKFYNGEIPWATVRDMKYDLIEETEHKITTEAVKKSSTNIIPKGNVIIATRVGLGKVCLLKEDTAINQDLRGIVPKNSTELSVDYLFRWLKSIAHIIEKEGTGATVQGVKLPFVKSLPIPIPLISEQRSIVAKLDALSAETKRLEAIYQQKLAALDELKKSVLQKAFNGELTGA
jgi:type I restriction enzyme S subunit